MFSSYWLTTYGQLSVSRIYATSVGLVLEDNSSTRITTLVAVKDLNEVSNHCLIWLKLNVYGHHFAFTK